MADANFATLADTIAADLREPLKLAPVARAYQTADPNIVETYWRARYLWSLREHQAIRQALRMLEDIAIKAPNYAPAHAAIADIYAHKSAEELAIDRAETYPLAEHHLERAFNLDPDLAEAFVTRAYLAFFRDRDANLAMSEIDKAIVQQPNNALAWQTKAMIASAAGQARTSLQAIDRAQDLDPLSAGIAWDKVWHLYNAGRHDDAINAATDAKRIAPPIHVYEALIHLSRDDDQAAFESWLNRALQRGLPQVRGDEIRQIAHADGPRAGLAAIAIDATAAEHYRELPLPHAALLLALGDNDAAIQVMLNDKPKEKSWWWSWYDVFPGIAPLRNDQRLQALSQTRGATVDG